MKTIHLTEQEKELILPAIRKRFDYTKTWYKQELFYKSNSMSHLKRLEEIQYQVNQHLTYLTSMNKALLTGIIREHLFDPNETKIYYYVKNPVKAESNSEFKTEIEHLNIIILILNKLLPKKEHIPLIQ